MFSGKYENMTDNKRNSDLILFCIIKTVTRNIISNFYPRSAQLPDQHRCGRAAVYRHAPGGHLQLLCHQVQGQAALERF